MIIICFLITGHSVPSERKEEKTANKYEMCREILNRKKGHWVLLLILNQRHG